VARVRQGHDGGPRRLRIFYGTDSLYRMDDYSQVFPYAITQTFSRLTSDPTVLTLSNPWPVSRVGYAGVTSSYGRATTSPETQYLQSWNLSAEHELRTGTIVELAYAGSKGTHLPRRYDINQPSLDPSAVRPYPAFGSIMVIANGSNSIYHSGQVSLRQRIANELFVRMSYTYAKSLDESSNTGGVLQYNFPQARTRTTCTPSGGAPISTCAMRSQAASSGPRRRRTGLPATGSSGPPSRSTAACRSRPKWPPAMSQA